MPFSMHELEQTAGIAKNFCLLLPARLLPPPRICYRNFIPLNLLSANCLAWRLLFQGSVNGVSWDFGPLALHAGGYSAGGELPSQEGSQGTPAPGPRIPRETHGALLVCTEIYSFQNSHPCQLIYINTTEEDRTPFICTALSPFTKCSHIYYLIYR